MAATGTPIFDALAVTVIEINRLKKTLVADAAFVNTKTGATHGWTKGEGTIWSEETKAAAAALEACVERDMARQHFGSLPTELGSTVPGQPAQGLGEHLSDSDGTRSV